MPFITQGKTNWKLLLIVFILAVIVGGGILLFVNRQKTPNIQFSINSEKEAIAYAKTDPDVKEFLSTFETDTRVSFDKEKNIWTVLFVANGVTDTCFQVIFELNGTIISKYDPCEA